jgi:hypothetical protein
MAGSFLNLKGALQPTGSNSGFAFAFVGAFMLLNL